MWFCCAVCACVFVSMVQCDHAVQPCIQYSSLVLAFHLHVPFIIIVTVIIIGKPIECCRYIFYFVHMIRFERYIKMFRDFVICNGWFVVFFSKNSMHVCEHRIWALINSGRFQNILGNHKINPIFYVVYRLIEFLLLPTCSNTVYIILSAAYAKY